MSTRPGRPSPVYIYMHIPKCAGSTLAYHLEQNFPKSALMPLYGDKFYNHAFGRFEQLFAEDDMQEHLRNLSGEKKARFRFVYGHRVYFGLHAHFTQPARYITFLRDPVLRTVSAYYEYRRRHRLKLYMVNPLPPGMDFDEWLEMSEPRIANQMTRLVSREFDESCLSNSPVEKGRLSLAKANLEKFFYVGITEHASIDLAYLFALFGIKKYYKNRNTTVQRDVDITPWRVAAISSKNKLDRDLYEYALALNRAQRRTRVLLQPKMLIACLRRCAAHIREPQHSIFKS